VPPLELPGQALAAELYLAGGIRGVEIGTVMFGRRDRTRRGDGGADGAGAAGIPRRVYTQSHMDYVVEVILEVFDRREQIGGFRITHQAPALRHFSARFEPLYPFGS
jgi:tyrosine phenol-lyase